MVKAGGAGILKGEERAAAGIAAVAVGTPEAGTVEVGTAGAGTAGVGNQGNVGMLNKNFDYTLYGYYALMIVFVIGLSMPRLAGLLFLGIGLFYLFRAGWIFYSQSEDGHRSAHHARNMRQESIPSTISAPLTREPTIAYIIKSIHAANHFKCPSCGATVKPTATMCGHCGSYLVASADLPKPNIWGNVELGQTVRVFHPHDGELALSVMRRIYYGELWQVQMKPDVPWTLTGNYFVGLMLNKENFLLNWQSRFYLLDFSSALTDMDINRDFAPYARKFAASNQTQNVKFDYNGAKYRINDIGRFRVEFCDGDGCSVSPGAVGRFIHASSNNKALIIEDYQSGGGGSDTLWRGYLIEEKAIRF